MNKLPETWATWAMRRRTRYIEYASWCYHHGSDPMTWEAWKAAWNERLIR